MVFHFPGVGSGVAAPACGCRFIGSMEGMAGEPRVLHPPLRSTRAKPGSHRGELAGKLGS